MINREDYLKDKQAQIDKWIAQLARLNALRREAGDDVRIKFEVQLTEFSQHLRELQQIFLKFEDLSEDSRNKFRRLVEKYWKELEESFEKYVSEYEHLCKRWIEG